ncbi:hypothetical protein DERP_012030 [Dermatophagoides pteronyssinus]|uniref:Uncharacterized protein n=1 Tax=Dermatophagoides pteronyssinus TaxID=6956 RepID=A0ABQ8IVP9_DERPT|nr:hypothetical protein DERP_012030 [Dermatophagoides pteronyssinus]
MDFFLFCLLVEYLALHSTNFTNPDNQINTSFSLSETNSKTSAKLKISTREIYGQRQRQDYMAKISSRFVFVFVLKKDNPK